MAVSLSPGILVLVDREPTSETALEYAARFADEPAVLATVDCRYPDGALPVVRSLSSSPTMTEVLRTAAARQIPYVAMRRDVADPATLVGELIMGAGRAENKDLPGFAVVLSGASDGPIRRILAVADRGTGPISGFMTYVAVDLAARNGAPLDVLVLGAPGEEVDSLDEHEALAINREQEYLDEALALAQRRGVQITWLAADGDGPTWTVVGNQIRSGEYDLVVDEIGEISVSGQLRKGISVEQAMSPGHTAELALHLLERTTLPIVVVIDAIRVGIPLSPMLRVGAVAAAAMAFVAGGVITANQAGQAQAPVSAAAELAAEDEGLRSQAEAATKDQAPQAKASTTSASGPVAPASIAAAGQSTTSASGAVTAAGASSKTTATQGGAAETETAPTPALPSALPPIVVQEEAPPAEPEPITDAEAAEMTAAELALANLQAAQAQIAAEADRAKETKQSSRSASKEVTSGAPAKPSVPKGGARKADVSKAKADQKAARAAAAKAKEKLDAAKAAEKEAAAALADAQSAIEDSILEVSKAAEVAEERTATADSVVADTTGIRGWLPGGPTEEDAQYAQAQAADAQEWVEGATVRADDAVASIEELTAAQADAAAELAKREEKAAAAKAELADAKAQTEAVQKSYDAYLAEQEAKRIAAEKAAKEKAAAEARAKAAAEAKARAAAAARAKALANSKVSPVAPGSYRTSATYGQAGPYWSSGYHTGLDFAASSGTTVRAAASGTVVRAGWAGAYGNQIEIDHGNGVRSTYAHLSSMSVSPGQKVTAGQKIGGVGSTGNSTGPHLHFEVYRGGSRINPASWLGW